MGGGWHCRGGLELTQATAAVWCWRVALGTRATEGAWEVLAPARRAGTALGTLVHVCGEEGSSRTPPHCTVHGAYVGSPLLPGWGTSIPRRPRPRDDSHGQYLYPRPVPRRLGPILGATPGPAGFIGLRSPALYPIPDPDPSLTAAGPAPLAAVARLTGDALEAPGFVLAFAIRAGARVSAFVDICLGGRRRTRLGITWPDRHSGSSAGPPSITGQQGKPALLGFRTPTSERP